MNIGKKIFIGVGTILLAVGLAANIACGMFFEVITGFIHGSGVDFSGAETEHALAQSDKLCRDVVEEGIVLLKNDDCLPITKTELSQVNIFGWRATDAGWIAGGSGSVNANNNTARAKVLTLLQAMDENGYEYNTEIIDMYERYCSTGDGKALNDGVSFFTLKEPTADMYTPEMIQRAKDFSDIAFVVFGRQGGEGCDLPKYQLKYGGLSKDTSRTYLDVSTEEEALLEMVTTNFDRVVVIVNAVNVMNFNFLAKYENIDACLWVSGTGQSGTYSLLRTLRGKVNPSGKMVNTMPYEFSDDPTYANLGADASGNIVYAENIYVGYRWFETADKEGFWDGKTRTYPMVKADASTVNNTLTGYDSVVQFPFGYGLSYTTFDWEIVSATSVSDPITKDTEFRFEVSVTNTGERKGKDVVELYYSAPYTQGGIEKSAVCLGAYAKTNTILPGESETVELSFDAYTMASYDDYDKNSNGFKGYELEKGSYKLSFRTDAHNLKNCENNTYTYTLFNDIRFENDPVSGDTVENRFTGTSAYGGTPIDGTTRNSAIRYLSRSNFAGTMPQHFSASGGNTSFVPTMPEATMPNFGNGQPGEYLLYKDKEGGAATETQLKTGENLVPNHDLLMQLGENYNDPIWDKLMDQMTAAEMSNLIELGGYRQREAVSVGKKYGLDNDGGSGLNRHINEQDNNVGGGPDRTSWTLFFSTNVLAATWNDVLAYSLGLAIGNEAVNTGIDGWYSPACNMMRSQLDGRIAEYVSEDPLISGKITAAQVRGANANGLYTYVKHFAVNETENGRSGLYTWLTEQSLREIYLKTFEITVKEGKTQGLMTSFNRLGCIWTGGNRALCTDILRNEWGFCGATVTDYFAGPGLMPLKQGLYAGQDLWLTGSHNKVGGFLSSDATFMTQARLACKNILFMKANVYYISQSHDPSEDVITTNLSTIKVRYAPFPYWVFGLVGIDLVWFGGLAVAGYFVFRKPKGAKAAQSQPVNRGKGGNGNA